MVDNVMIAGIELLKIQSMFDNISRGDGKITIDDVKESGLDTSIFKSILPDVAGAEVDFSKFLSAVKTDATFRNSIFGNVSQNENKVQNKGVKDSKNGDKNNNIGLDTLQVNGRTNSVLGTAPQDDLTKIKKPDTGF